MTTQNKREKIKLIHEEMAEHFNINVDSLEDQTLKPITSDMVFDIIMNSITKTNEEIKYESITPMYNQRTITIIFESSEIVENESVNVSLSANPDHEKIRNVQKQKLPAEFDKLFNKNIFKSMSEIIVSKNENPKNYNRNIMITTSVTENSLTIEF